jgi:hypothetical protein
MGYSETLVRAGSPDGEQGADYHGQERTAFDFEAGR